MQDTQARQLLRDMFEAAVAAAMPSHCLPGFLPSKPKGRLLVIGAGKASAAMAQALEACWDGPLSGLVVTRYGYGATCKQIEIVEAAHPVPDQAGLTAARRLMQMVQGLTADDLVLCLISGGGSSLIPLPLDGITLEQKQEVNRQLLKSGATIGEMNCVRRHLSAIKGGRLAVACYPAKVVNLLISDVPGDDPADVASGPSVPDATTCADALEIVGRYKLALPAHILAMLRNGSAESPKPGSHSFPAIETHFIATPQMALEAAAKVARAQGLVAHILGDGIEGEARDVAKVHAGIVHQIMRQGQPFSTPCVLLSGGETTVTLRGHGRGGRNVEFLLSLGLALQAQAGVYALAGDTDGVDGQEEIAGALLTPDTLSRAWAAGLHPMASLVNNDGHGFFQTLGDSVVTGPTLTNVNDFRAILVTGDPSKERL